MADPSNTVAESDEGNNRAVAAVRTRAARGPKDVAPCV